MKNLFLLLSILLCAGCCTQKSQNDLKLKVMSFNIRNGKANDGPNSWEHRKELVAEVIRNYNPDVIGLQEAYRFQMDYLNKTFPNFDEAGTGRDGGTKGEYSAILFNKIKFQQLGSGTFWLSDTPEKPSAGWGNRYRRICTWIHLKDKALQEDFYVFNTHLDHQSQTSREKSVKLIIDRIIRGKSKGPVVLTGDFNAGEDNKVVTFLKDNSFKDSYRSVYPDEKVVGTGNGRYTGRLDGPKIDYIFIQPGATVLKASILNGKIEGRFPSDHYPVTADLILKK